MSLTPEDMATLEVYVTPAAWAAHAELPIDQQVAPAAALAVWRDLRLVAAAMLDAVAFAAGGLAAEANTIKRVKIEGELEIERTGNSAQVVSATNWSARADQLRLQVVADQRRSRRLGSSVIPVQARF